MYNEVVVIDNDASYEMSCLLPAEIYLAVYNIYKLLCY